MSFVPAVKAAENYRHEKNLLATQIEKTKEERNDDSKDQLDFLVGPFVSFTLLQLIFEG